MLTTAPLPLAHGIGTRTDLPLPALFVYYGAGFAVLVSFAVLLVAWRAPKLGDERTGRPSPAALDRLVRNTWVRTLAQAVTLAVAVLLVAVAFAGPPETPDNLAPWAVYVTFWVGLIPASLLLGPVWRYANPLRLLHRGLARLTGPARGRERLPRLGLWPASLSLLVFVWLELVYPGRAEPPTVGVFLVAYALAQLGAACWFGEEWFARGDGFEVYSTLMGRLSVWARDPQGRLVVRNPLTNVRTTPAEHGLAAVVVVLLGSTAFDGLTRTEFWTQGPGADNGTVSGTLGLLVSVAVVGAVYVGATRASGRLAGEVTAQQPRLYAHSIIPIAVAYSVAHYASLFLVDGQTTWILASNPFGIAGVDLFGTYDRRIDYAAVSIDAIAVTQVLAIVAGHVLGTVLAHEQALRASRRARGSDQLPLVLVMVVYTVLGLSLLFGF